MFQNEMPYNPPNQAAWSHDDSTAPPPTRWPTASGPTKGGGGILLLLHVNPNVVNAHAFEVPNIPAVQFHDLVTVSLGGVGTIDHVINDTGATANTSNQVIYLLSYQ